ncbi:type IVB secretion system protein IcmH/DotU [Methylobacterium indicum]|uniref:type IVB secretion system protein IcmH/DotU n=1 Tax=Methylobacterium indicum TaxID=1775910 RepID=UPI002435CBDE|nr:type IVB secretion system protein IcmH/DotU [Methylobacterium indicum]
MEADPRGYDSESTVVKPTPGGVRAPTVLHVDPRGAGPRDVDPRDAGPRVPPPAEEPVPGDFARAGMPPMVEAALPLLSLIARLRTLSGTPDLEALRLRVVAAVKAFEAAILGVAVTRERAQAAHYALCATIDDVILNSSWGAYSLWARQGMVSTFHTDVTGGERFFDLLAHLHKDPGSNRDVLLLMYHCLSLGFEGRMRVHPQGHLEIGRIREGLYRTLRGEAERELSPAWRGVDARLSTSGARHLLWAGAGLAVLVLAGLFLLLQSAVNRRSDATFAAFIAAPPNTPPSLRGGPPGPAAAPVAAKAQSRLVDSLRRTLKREIDDGTLDVVPNGNGATLRIRNAGLFQSGSAEVAPAYTALFERIGQAVRGEDVSVQVIGHTDNVPIRTVRFPSNYELSVARAQAVAAILARSIGTDAIRAEGRGEAQPVRPNDSPANIAFNNSPEGRTQNRRTELVIRRNGSPTPPDGSEPESGHEAGQESGRGSGRESGEVRP